MPKQITLEEAVEKYLEAKAEWQVALAMVAVAQYKHELAGRLGKLAFLLDNEEEIHGGN